MSAKKRIDYLDVAKGIAILSVVVGHTFSAYDPGSFLNKFIYSFHMPLFFILSGYFFKSQEFKPALNKKVKHLLMPYVIINLVRCLNAFFQYGFSQKILTDYFFPALYGNGSTPKAALCLVDVKIVGMTWFLAAMFVCQVLYLILDEVSKKYGTPMWPMVILLALVGIELNDKIWFPFSIQPAMGGLVFFHTGRLMREKKILEEDIKEVPKGALVLGFLLWMAAVFYESLGMHANSYKGVGAVIGAVCATYFIVQLSKFLYRVPYLGIFLNWCGRNSVYIYCFHAIDRNILIPIKEIILRVIDLPSTKGALLFSVIRLSCVIIGAFVFLTFKKYVQKALAERKGKV